MAPQASTSIQSIRRHEMFIANAVNINNATLILAFDYQNVPQIFIVIKNFKNLSENQGKIKPSEK